MAGPITISVVGDVRDLVRGVGSAKGELQGLGKYGQTAGRVMRAGLAAGAVGAVALGVKIKGAASDAQQSLGATETVFGRFADTVIDRSEDAAESVGLSANEYRELANVLGAGLKGAGVPLAEVTDLTDQLNTRAADLAATFGGPTSEAVAAIGSLLRGEADPIERYGISIKEADVQARLAAKGLGDLEGAAAKQAAMQERVAMLLTLSKDSAGAFAREADTAAGAEQRLAASTEDLAARAGTLLLPVYTDVVNLARRELLPVLEDGVEWFEANRDELADLGATVKDSVLPVLGTLADVGGALVDVFTRLPGPVQSLAVQAAAASLVMPELTGGLRNVGAAAAVTVGNLRNAETRAKALGGVARNAAGIGGVLALSTSATSSSKALGVLGNVAGGALLGFSVGGPIGGAIGAGVGGLKSLYDITQDNAAAAESHAAKAREEAAAIDRIAAASGRARREEALRLVETSGAAAQARQLGLETNVLVAGLLGNSKALKAVNRAWRDHQGVTDAAAIAELTDFLTEQGFAIKQSERRLDEHRAGLKKWDGKVDETAGNVKGANRDLGNLGNVKPSGKFADLYLGDLDRAGTQGRRQQQQNNAGLLAESRQARADISPFSNGLIGNLGDLGDRARTAASNVGSDIGSGLVGGLGDWLNDAFSAGAALAGEAIRGARSRRGADTNSPSRKTRKVAEDMGAGLVGGLRRAAPAAREAGAALARAAADGADRARRDADRRTEEQRKRARKRLLKGVAADLDAAVKLTRTKLKDLQRARADYVASIADAARATADITQLGLREDGTQTAEDLRAGLEARLAAVRNFEAKVAQLVGMGLRGDALRQLLAAGVDAGTVTAEALLAGGEAAVADTVRLTNQIAKAAGDLGDLGAQQFHDAGIKAQQSLLRGLLADRKALDKAAGKMARRLAQRIRRELADGLGDYDRVTRSKAAGGRGRVRVDATAAGSRANRAAVTLSAEQLSQLERGRRISLDLDAYRRNGGRPLTRT